jgi:hypothetical protein
VLPGHERQLAALRGWLASFLPDCAARHDVVAVASELAANAVRHTASGQGGWFAVGVSWHPQVVRVAVADGGGPGEPTVLDGPTGEHGRGLKVVAGQWVAALEDAAPSADWLDYARWTARTPFTEPGAIPALINALPSVPTWAPTRAAVEAAWDRLFSRAMAGSKRARQAAGPPGYRAVAAAACALAWADPDTRLESQLLAAVTAGPLPLPGWLRHPWQAASRAWLDAVALDADTAAANAALLATVEEFCAGAQVRNVSLLAGQATGQGWQFASPADWAAAEFEALCHEVASSWCQWLGDALASLQGHDDDDWLLLRVKGWPLTDDADRELAYLAAYPELARAPDPHCGQVCGRSHRSWVAVLHVPAFAAMHAVNYQGAHFDATPGPAVPADAKPSPGQLRALLAGSCHLADDAWRHP